jgi:hypothetical protein
MAGTIDTATSPPSASERALKLKTSRMAINVTASFQLIAKFPSLNVTTTQSLSIDSDT